MGYYSDVAYALHKDDYDRMIQEAKDTAREEYNRDIEMFLTTGAETTVNEEEGIVAMKWTFVKWYDYFPEVRFISDFLANNDVDYSFIRIGESDDDLEIEEAESPELAIAIRFERRIVVNL